VSLREGATSGKPAAFSASCIACDSGMPCLLPVESWRLRSRFRIPANESALIAEIHRVGHVLELRYEENDTLIVAHVPPDLAQKLERYAEQ